MRGRTLAIVIAGTLAAALVASQLIVPPLVAGGIEQRLTERGGEAEATVRALPVLRLVAGDGDRLEVRGHGLRLDLEPAADAPLEKLDGFGEVEIELREFEAGPLTVSEFALTRSGGNPYRLRAQASTTPADVAAYGVSQLAGLGGLLGRVARAAVPETGPLPIDLDLAVESDDGRMRVRGGRATIAGFPASLLVELLGNSVLARL